MPVMTLTFNLPDEAVEAETAQRAGEWRSAVEEIVSELRRRLKYEGAGEELEKFNQWVWDELKDRNLDPWG